MLDERIQAYLRAVTARGREVVPAGASTAYLHPRDPLRFLNYAIPDAGATEPPDEAPFTARRRLARVEYVESVAPGLAGALERAGWTCEARLDLMTCTPSTLLRPGVPSGVALEAVPGDAPREVVRDLLDATRGAFSEAPAAATEEDVAAWGSGGGAAVLARAEAGAPAGGGSFTAPLDGLCEITGVGVLPAFRRRGIAAALVSTLAETAFARGVEIAFLTPGDDDTRRVYERAGFAATSTMLAYAREG